MLSGVDYEICKTQGNVYEYLAKNGYDMELFSLLYLQSDFCRRAFDTNYSRFQLADELECLDFIVPELKERYPEFCENITEDYVKVKEVDTCFSPDVAYWIGFTYRQLYIETGITSKELSERLPFDAMCRYYPGLHTVDEEMATDIICKDYHFVKYKDNEMRKIIEDKLGFNIKEYNRQEQEALKKMKEAGQCDSHECDNIPSPFEKLSLEELEYLREHNYFLD